MKKTIYSPFPLSAPAERIEAFADRVHDLAEERGLSLSYTMRDDGPLTFEVWGEHDQNDVIAIVGQAITEFELDRPIRRRTTEELLAGAHSFPLVAGGVTPVWEEVRVPAGYTAEELDRDNFMNPHNEDCR